MSIVVPLQRCTSYQGASQSLKEDTASRSLVQMLQCKSLDQSLNFSSAHSLIKKPINPAAYCLQSIDKIKQLSQLLAQVRSSSSVSPGQPHMIVETVVPQASQQAATVVTPFAKWR